MFVGGKVSPSAGVFVGVPGGPDGRQLIGSLLPPVRQVTMGSGVYVGIFR